MNLDSFLEIENKYGLVQDKIDGFAYWVYFRGDLERDIMKKRDLGKEMKFDFYPTRSGWKQFKARIGTIIYALLYGRIPGGKHDILFFNLERRVWTGSFYECIYTDKIAAEYPDSVVLERPYCQKHFRPVKTKNLVYTDPIEIKTMVYWYFQELAHKDRIANIREILYNKIHEPMEKICNAYQVEYDINMLLDKMVCGYYVYKIKKKEFKKILDKIRPRIVVEVTGDNLDCMVINELALERHIPTVELQHGSTGEEHIAYNFYPGTRVEQFPGYFFAFSKFWLDAAAARYPIAPDRLKEVGFPYLDAKAGNIKKKVSKSFPYKIIFISQITIGEILSEIAIALNQLIDTEQYQIIYKLHPFEYEGWRERYPGLAASGIEVYDNNHVDLYELFAASAYQVGGFSSTAIFEGLYFGLKTYIMREGAYPEVRLLCENGLAQFFDSAENLYQMILEEPELAGAQTSFWKENALDHIKKEVDVIMNGGI